MCKREIERDCTFWCYSQFTTANGMLDTNTTNRFSFLSGSAQNAVIPLQLYDMFDLRAVEAVVKVL